MKNWKINTAAKLHIKYFTQIPILYYTDVLDLPISNPVFSRLRGATVFVLWTTPPQQVLFGIVILFLEVWLYTHIYRGQFVNWMRSQLTYRASKCVLEIWLYSHKQGSVCCLQSHWITGSLYWTHKGGPINNGHNVYYDFVIHTVLIFN